MYPKPGSHTGARFPFTRLLGFWFPSPPLLFRLFSAQLFWQTRSRYATPPNTSRSGEWQRAINSFWHCAYTLL